MICEICRSAINDMRYIELIGGWRIYFGFTSESTYVRACGLIGGVSLRAREIADLMSHDPAWWEMWSKQYPTVEEWARWQ